MREFTFDHQGSRGPVGRGPTTTTASRWRALRPDERAALRREMRAGTSSRVDPRRPRR